MALRILAIWLNIRRIPTAVSTEPSITHKGGTKKSPVIRAILTARVTENDIDRRHKQRGFKMVGYHFIIRLDGTIEQGRPLEMIGAHCSGHNAHSIGICYIGGLDKSGKPKDTRTQVQIDVLWSLAKSLQKEFPEATVHG